MRITTRGLFATALTAFAAMTTTASAAPATNLTLTSWDGTTIVVHEMPQPGNVKAPTILVGPGWGGSGVADSSGSEVEFLQKAGYNVVSWDPRGFGESGGVVSFNNPKIDGRDVQKIIDHVATRPWAQLDRPGDPRLGMFGGSYGAGIQYATASIDKRVDALAASVGWYSLRESLYPSRTFKQGFAKLLYVSGKAAAERVGGAAGGLPAQLGSGYEDAARTGTVSRSFENWFAAQGPQPSDFSKITAPTLVIGGTIDTLFALRQQVTIFNRIRAAGTRTKMLWVCAGHGICNTGNGGGAGDRRAVLDSVYAQQRVLTWLNAHVKRQKIATGPVFEWVSDDAKWRTSSSFPAKAGKPVTVRGKGSLKFSPGEGDGTDVSAAPAKSATALTIAFRPGRAAQLVGAPRLTGSYRATGEGKETRVYAQIVDIKRKLVVGNHSTPVVLKLDGKSHELSLPLALIASTAGKATGYELQLVSASKPWTRQRATGTVTFGNLKLSIPTLR